MWPPHVLCVDIQDDMNTCSIPLPVSPFQGTKGGILLFSEESYHALFLGQHPRLRVLWEEFPNLFHGVSPRSGHHCDAAFNDQRHVLKVALLFARLISIMEAANTY